MRKARFLLAIAFIFGLATVTPTAEAGCFTDYMNAIVNCSNLDGYIARDACGLDSYIDLAGCVRKGIFGV